ncbi:hypothetical protein V8C44DRAFT_339373 [Trichoderma aethiopicum]
MNSSLIWLLLASIFFSLLGWKGSAFVGGALRLGSHSPALAFGKSPSFACLVCPPTTQITFCVVSPFHDDTL